MSVRYILGHDLRFCCMPPVCAKLSVDTPSREGCNELGEACNELRLHVSAPTIYLHHI